MPRNTSQTVAVSTLPYHVEHGQAIAMQRVAYNSDVGFQQAARVGEVSDVRSRQ